MSIFNGEDICEKQEAVSEAQPRSFIELLALQPAQLMNTQLIPIDLHGTEK